jgi:hypothetical protein
MQQSAFSLARIGFSGSPMNEVDLQSMPELGQEISAWLLERAQMNVTDAEAKQSEPVPSREAKVDEDAMYEF